MNTVQLNLAIDLTGNQFSGSRVRFKVQNATKTVENTIAQLTMDDDAF